MRRRTSSGRGAGLALALALVAAGCGQQTEPPSGGEPVDPSEQQSPSAGPADDVPVLPAGWRWEAYGGVQVGVPGEFGWGNGDQRLGQWCVDEDRHPIVGRPGVTTLVGCGIGADTDPGTLLVNTGPVVAFGSGFRGADDAGRDAAGRDGKVSRQEDGDRLTLTLNHVVVQIQAEPRLRESGSRPRSTPSRSTATAARRTTRSPGTRATVRPTPSTSRT